MIEIVEPRPESSLEFWAEIEPHVKAALEFDAYNMMTMDKLKEQVSNGYARVILCADGARILAATLVTLFLNTRSERILHVIATGGAESHRWLDVLTDHLHDMAAKEKCAAVTMAGRPGWARKLNKYGYKMDMISMRQEVSHGTEQKRVNTTERESTDVVQPAAADFGLSAIR